MPYRFTLPIGKFACLEIMMIGKPYAGELQVRFDEGEQDCVPRTILNGHEVGNDGYGQGSPYRMSRLFPTLALYLSADPIPVTCWNKRLLPSTVSRRASDKRGR